MTLQKRFDADECVDIRRRGLRILNAEARKTYVKQLHLLPDYIEISHHDQEMVGQMDRARQFRASETDTTSNVN